MWLVSLSRSEFLLKMVKISLNLVCWALTISYFSKSLSLKNSAKNSVKAEFSDKDSASAEPEPNVEKLTSVSA